MNKKNIVIIYIYIYIYIHVDILILICNNKIIIHTNIIHIGLSYLVK